MRRRRAAAAKEREEQWRADLFGDATPLASARSIGSVPSTEVSEAADLALVPSSSRGAEALAKEAEAAAARAAAQAEARARAITYAPLEPPPPSPSVFTDENVLAVLPPKVAESAEHYHAAAAKAEALLRRQHDTLRRLQFVAARLASEVRGTPDAVPADGWDAEAEVGKPRARQGLTAEGEHAIGAHLRRFVELHSIPDYKPPPMPKPADLPGAKTSTARALFRP